MSSNVAKGKYYKAKTKKWLAAQGYHVEDMEKMQRIFGGNGKIFLVHKDICGADVLAMNGKEIIFVQVKTKKGDVNTAIKEFAKYPFPDSVLRWVVLWTPRVKEPLIHSCK